MEERRLFSNIQVIIIINFFLQLRDIFVRGTSIIHKRTQFSLLRLFLLEQRDTCEYYS